MNTVAFKKITSMFGDSEFQKSEFEDFATALLFLAISRQSWDISKNLISNWHSEYTKMFLKKGWLREKENHYEMTLIFQGHSEREIERGIMCKDIFQETLPDDEETFEVGKYTVKINEIKQHMSEYISHRNGVTT